MKGLFCCQIFIMRYNTKFLVIYLKIKFLNLAHFNPRGAAPSYSWEYFKCCDQSLKYAETRYLGSVWYQDDSFLTREITLIALAN